MSENQGSGKAVEPSIDDATGDRVERAEDNLSRHSTVDSHPAVPQQERTTQPVKEQSGGVTKTEFDEGVERRS